jgi:Raf kinase inhibitor-like YbhB/YbcL family protein
MSPPLSWTDSPPSKKQFALIADDPDAPAGTWVHWVIYSLPPSVRRLAAGFPTDPETKNPVSARQGLNDFRTVGYGGPCPPKGPQHRYFFRLYALDIELSLPPRTTKDVLWESMKGHVLEEAVLVGKYGR